MFNYFEELFAPGRKHATEEQKRLELTRVDLGVGDPGRGPIDLASGKVVVRATDAGGGPGADRDAVPEADRGATGAIPDPDEAVDDPDGRAAVTGIAEHIPEEVPGPQATDAPGTGPEAVPDAEPEAAPDAGSSGAQAAPETGPDVGKGA